MSLNAFAEGTEPLDLTASEEFASLTASAADLDIPHAGDVRYLSRNVVVRRHRFHVLEWGAEGASEILMLHGGHQSAHSWDLVSLHLAGRYRVFAPDQRGHGDSEWARDCAYSNEEMARDAAALVRTLGLERPVVMGHSMGGRNALLMALENPGLCRALVIVDVGPEISPEGRQAIGSFVRANEEFDDLEHFVENVRRYDPYRSREHIERTVRYNLFRRADGKYISKCDRAPRRLGLLERQSAVDALTLDAVAALDMPVLVVRGENSNILAPDAAERFVATLPQGELVTVPDCGHNVHSQNTLGFLRAIGDFLEEEHTMIHELRIYTVHPGRMPAMLARFRDHTCKLFEKHGIRNVAYWLNTVGGRNDELWYVVGFDDMGHRERAWASFQADPEWQAVRAASEEDGPIVHHIENRFLAPTDFSPIG